MDCRRRRRENRAANFCLVCRRFGSYANRKTPESRQSADADRALAQHRQKLQQTARCSVQLVFELVQELRKHRRRPAKSGIVSPFSGLLYCADCGEKLYYSFSNNYKREQAYFFCSSYRKNSDACSAHYIREKVVEQLVLESMQRIMLNVQIFEKEFARK